MSLDIEIIVRKILLSENDFRKLKQISLLSFKEYQAKDYYEPLAERYLERIIGRMININYHVLAADKGVSPVDYYSSFVLMGEHGYLPEDLAKSLARAAGLRNRLAHEYDELDSRKFYNAIAVAIKEIPEYFKLINKLIETFSKQKKML